LMRKFGDLEPAIVEQINGLSLGRADDLAVALLDFEGMEDLMDWLGR
jgi:Domain of unknown function (DUF4351)